MRDHEQEITGKPATDGRNEPSSGVSPEKSPEKLIGVPVCISVEQMFNIINEKLDALLNDRK